MRTAPRLAESCWYSWDSLGSGRSGPPVQVVIYSAVYPKAIVKDARTGETIAIARGGSMDLATDALALEVLFSDGVRTLKRTLTVQR